MRTQTTTTGFDAQDLLVQPVDPTGWLAGPSTPAGTGGVGRGGVDLQGDERGVDQQDPITTPPRSVGRADGGSPVGSGKRSARRTGRVRHLRRIRTESLRAAPVRVDPTQAAGIAQAVGTAQAARTAQAAGAAPPNDGELTVPTTRAVPVRSAATVDSAPEGYQMGRWARVTVTITVLAAVVVVVASLMAAPNTNTYVDVTVAPGDTLWSIATKSAPDRDPRDVVEEIRLLNDMQGGVLPIGVVLRVPSTSE